MSFVTALAVMCGGAAGAVCRFVGNAAVMRAIGGGYFPYGILCINVLGGLLMGLLFGAIERSGKPHAVVYGLLGTGFLGGFTTFSSFSIDTLSLYQQDYVLGACMNIVLNAVLCIFAAGLGYIVSTNQDHKMRKAD